MKRYLIGLIVVLCVVTGCSKAGGAADDGHVDNNPADTIAPVITITSPTPAQVYANGATISVTGSITDQGGLYRGSIRITNDANNAVVKEQAYEIHGFLSYNFNLTHIAAVNVVSNYTVTVSFEDHGWNTTSKSVKITVNP